MRNLLNLMLSDFEFDTPKDDSNFNKTIEESETKTHSIKTETWESEDGSQFYKKTTMNLKSSSNDVEKLKIDMEKAIQKEDFESAAKIRDKIKSIKNSNKQ